MELLFFLILSTNSISLSYATLIILFMTNYSPYFDYLHRKEKSGLHSQEALCSPEDLTFQRALMSLPVKELITCLPKQCAYLQTYLKSDKGYTTK